MKKIICGILFAFVLFLAGCGGSNGQKKNGEISEKDALNMICYSCFFSNYFDMTDEDSFIQDPKNAECEIGYEYDLDWDYDDEDDESAGFTIYVSYSAVRRNKETKEYESCSDLYNDPNSKAFDVIYTSTNAGIFSKGFYYMRNPESDDFDMAKDFKKISLKEFLNYAKIDIWQLSSDEICKGVATEGNSKTITLDLKGEKERAVIPASLYTIRTINNDYRPCSKDFAVKFFNGKIVLGVTQETSNKIYQQTSTSK